MIINMFTSPEPSQNRTNFQVLLPTLQVLRSSRIGWKPYTLPKPECSSAFLISTFILLINYSDSDSEHRLPAYRRLY